MKSTKDIFSSKAAKVSRALLLSGVAAIAVSGCATYAPHDNRPNWNDVARQKQINDYLRQERYVQEGRELERTYLLRQYHSCKTDIMAGGHVSKTCDNVIRKVEHGYGR